MCTDESFTIRPGMCNSKVNMLKFDFMLTLALSQSVSSCTIRHSRDCPLNIQDTGSIS